MQVGHDVIAALVERPDRATLIMDFDGTLSPIVDDPSASRLPAGTAALLEELAGHLGVVALLSGRPVSFLAERASITGVTLMGSYGVETHHQGQARALPDAERWQPTVLAASSRLHEHFDGFPGIFVEDKGLAVAVHWRKAPDQPAAQQLVQAFITDLAKETGLHREPGKLVEELRPPLAEDKGTAVRRIVEDTAAQCVVYAGDDLGDIPAFTAATELGGYALVVAHGAETASAVTAAAHTIFEGTESFTDWLRRLERALAASNGHRGH